MRIGFLFNHDQIHQVAHSLPIALALADGGFNGELIVATTSVRLTDEVRRLGGTRIGTRISHLALGRSTLSAAFSGALGSAIPMAKFLVYRDNLAFFRSLDVLVVAEKASLVLKTVYGLTNLRIVHTRHGAGDRAIGFDKSSALFDHVLCSGTKIRDRLISEANVPPERISIVGYPKFDCIQPSTAFPYTDASRPIVLYNPHPSPHLSSWYRHGREVLDFFLGNADYQLIFAPHVMLFERAFVATIDKLRISCAGSIAKKYLRGSDIHIDLGSRRSTDMSYTNAADIYLGDVSSQVYEFLYRPRPCLFLNSHKRDWKNDQNFEHWKAGPVVNTPAELTQGLRTAVDTHATQYKSVQMAMFARSFDLSERSSSVRAAEAILRFAERALPLRAAKHARLDARTP